MLSSSVGDWGSQRSHGIPLPIWNLRLSEERLGRPEGLTAILPDSCLLGQRGNTPAPEGMDACGGFGFCSADGGGGAAPG